MSQSRPTRRGKLPTVLVIHENRGLNPHIEDIARRLALDNFLAVAPDALTPARRLPGRRGQGARGVSEARSGEDARGLHRRHQLRADPPGFHGQDWRGRLLLRRRHGELPRDARAGAAGRRALLRRRGRRSRTSRTSRPRCWSSTAATTSASSRLARIRGRAEGGQRASTRATSTRTPSTDSTTTPRRATTRPPPSWRGTAPIAHFNKYLR